MLIPKSALGITSHADRFASRYALGAVKIERQADGQPILVATDGRRMAALSWQEAEPQEYPDSNLGSLAADPKFETLLSIDSLKSLAKSAPKVPAKLLKSKPILDNVALVEALDAKQITLGAASLESQSRIEAPVVDGRFPRWRDVFTYTGGGYSPENSLSVRLDPDYLSEACKLLKDFAGNIDRDGVTLTVSREAAAEKPIVLSIDNAGRQGAVLIMPLAPGGREVDKQTVTAQEFNPATGKTAGELVSEYAAAVRSGNVLTEKQTADALREAERKIARLEKRIAELEQPQAQAA